MDTRTHLKNILIEKSVKLGDFTLSSGQKSNFYLDCRTTTLDAAGAYYTGLAVLEALQHLKPYPLAIGGLTLGADPIVSSVAALSHQQHAEKKIIAPVSAFIVRKETKKHGMQNLIEGWRGPEGSPVVIAEDTCTTGSSALQAIEHARAAGWRVVATVCIVDREEGGREAIEPLCPFYALFTARELVSAKK
jgi:orotate phosphoribosyltransferase